MKGRRPYKTICIGIFDGKRIFSKIDRVVLAHINEHEFVFAMSGEYVLVMDKSGLLVSHLHVLSYDLIAGPVAPRGEGHDVHHRNEDPLDNRIENLLLVERGRHQRHHRRRRRTPRGMKADVFGLWLPHAPAPVTSVPRLLHLGEAVKRLDPLSPMPSSPTRLHVLVKLATSGSSIAELERGRGLTRKQEQLLLRLTLRELHDEARTLAMLNHGTRPSKPIPRTVTHASYFDKETRALGIKPIQRGCRAAEAAAVCLLTVFDKAGALDFINQRIPEDIQLHLALAKPAAVRAGKPGAWNWVAPPPVFTMGALEWLLSRPVVNEALRRFYLYGRLPRTVGHWHPARMKTKKLKQKIVLPTQPIRADAGGICQPQNQPEPTPAAAVPPSPPQAA